jgi:NAD(P)-dependent dehydrogenase (short-subunit alcohol dehydrogenase family)
MRILVIGATGTIGKAVVELLEKENEVIKVSYSKGDYLVDISSKQSIQSLFDKIGKVDAVVSTAGIAGFGNLDELTDDDFELGLKNKLMGQVNLVRIGKNYVSEGGSITVTSGMLANEPIPGSAIISLVNAGLEGFIRASSLELDNIRVNAVSPVFVKETLNIMGMDSSTGMAAKDIAKTYKAAIEGNHHGEILDVRKFS